MIDSQGRILFKKEQILKANIKECQAIDIFFDKAEKEIVLFSSEDQRDKSKWYYVGTHKMDKKRRIYVPIELRKIFPEGSSYIPTEKEGVLRILVL